MAEEFDQCKVIVVYWTQSFKSQGHKASCSVFFSRARVGSASE